MTPAGGNSRYHLPDDAPPAAAGHADGHDAILARQIAVAEELRRRRLAIPMALDPVAARAAVQGLEDEAAALELARRAARAS